MLTARHKIKKQDFTPLEESVAHGLYELQVNNDKLKQTLREVQICSARESDVNANKKAVIIFVPVPQLALYQKMIKEKNLIEELEKKFSGKQIVVIAERRIIRKESRSSRQLKQERPRSRTLTAVHDAILTDLVYPNEIVGKRVRFAADGSRLIKVSIQQDGKANRDRTDTYVKVYKALTGKDVRFDFVKSSKSN